MTFPERALVTGGAGFIGSHLVDALVVGGTEVVVLDDFSAGRRENLKAAEKAVSVIEGSITDLSVVLKAAEGADTIFHQAAVASVPKSIEDPLGTHAVNVTGTLNVFEAACQQEVDRVVYASSCAVYGSDAPLPTAEGAPHAPESPYALHKSMGERYAKLYGERFGLEAVGLRYFNVFGPRQDPSSPYSGVVSIFFEKLMRGEQPTIYGDGSMTRDFVFVADVVRANLLAASASTAGGAYNVGTGRETSVGDLFGRIREVCGSDLDPTYAPERAGDIRRSVCDPSLAREALGFSAETDFAEDIEATYHSLVAS